MEQLVRLYVDETVVRHRLHVTSIPDKDGLNIDVLERDVEVVRNTSIFRILTFCEAEIGESKMIRLELEQETTKVVVIKERPKEPKIVKRVKLIVEMKLLGFSVGDHVMKKVHLGKLY
ncbi:hypothetical protein Tco_0507544 [Tanacetum coccineum]